MCVCVYVRVCPPPPGARTVCGCMIVSSGVIVRGVVSPNTAIVDGLYTFKSWVAARSNTFCREEQLDQLLSASDAYKSTVQTYYM